MIELSGRFRLYIKGVFVVKNSSYQKELKFLSNSTKRNI